MKKQCMKINGFSSVVNMLAPFLSFIPAFDLLVPRIK